MDRNREKIVTDVGLPPATRGLLGRGGDIVRWLRACGGAGSSVRVYIVPVDGNEAREHFVMRDREVTPELLHGYNQVADVRVGWVGARGWISCVGVAGDAAERLKDMGLAAPAVVKRPDGRSDAMVALTTREAWMSLAGPLEDGPVGFRAVLTEAARLITAALDGDPRVAALDAPLMPPSLRDWLSGGDMRSTLVESNPDALPDRRGMAWMERAHARLTERVEARRRAAEAGLDPLLEIEQLARADGSSGLESLLADQVALSAAYESALSRPEFARSLAGAILRAGGTLERVRQVLGPEVVRDALDWSCRDTILVGQLERKVSAMTATLAELRQRADVLVAKAAIPEIDDDIRKDGQSEPTQR